MRNFKQLKIWQKGFTIAIKSFKLTTGYPKEEKFGLVSQTTELQFQFLLILPKEAVAAVKKIIADLSKLYWVQV
jgi:hypothetical protein